MKWLADHISILIVGLFQFIAPAGLLFLITSGLVVAEYWFSQSAYKQDKDIQKFTMMDAGMKMAGFVLIIFLGLVADSAFHIRAENIRVLVEMGLTKEVSPLAYLFAVMCIVHEGKAVDRVFKKRYKASLLDQINFIPGLLDKLGYSKKK